MSKLTIDECKQIIMQGRKQLTAAEQRIAELEANNGSRWFELFGTPERAARTLSEHDTSCRDCLLGAYCGEECLTEEEPKLLEWLTSAI